MNLEQIAKDATPEQKHEALVRNLELITAKVKADPKICGFSLILLADDGHEMFRCAEKQDMIKIIGTLQVASTYYTQELMGKREPILEALLSASKLMPTLPEAMTKKDDRNA